MIPRIGKPGGDFRGAWEYMTRDKDSPGTADRVAWTSALNHGSDNGHEAVEAMIREHQRINAEKQGGRRRGKRIDAPVLHWQLSLHTEQERPGQAHWKETAASFLQVIGLADHRTGLAEHTDRDHSHLHGLTTLIEPATGRLNKKAISNIQLKASKWAEAYEREHGLKIYCQQRVANNEKRRNGQFVRYNDPELDLKAEITKLFKFSRTGAQFRAGVEKLGFRLAKGDRILLIDGAGKMHSISRQIEGAKAKEIRAKLADLDLPSVDEVRGRVLEQAGRERQRETRRAAQARLFKIYTNANRSRIKLAKDI